MKFPPSAAALALLAMLAAAPGGAWAHGDEKHAEGAAEAPYDGHAAALGEPGRAGPARTVAVVMSDAMRFTPSSITVKKGETIRFEVRNQGRVKHEMVLGTREELKAHAALMQQHPEMEHDDPNAVSVAPGQTGSFTWRFSKAGTFEFACLVPGHFEAGMVGTLKVGR